MKASFFMHNSGHCSIGISKHATCHVGSDTLCRTGRAHRQARAVRAVGKPKVPPREAHHSRVQLHHGHVHAQHALQEHRQRPATQAHHQRGARGSIAAPLRNARRCTPRVSVQHAHPPANVGDPRRPDRSAPRCRVPQKPSLQVWGRRLLSCQPSRWQHLRSIVPMSARPDTMAAW